MTHRRRLPLAALLLLAACAPAASPVSEPTALSAEQVQALCAGNPRVGDRGLLLWGPPEEETSLPGPYDVTCPDVTLTHSGTEVTVRAATLGDALARFTEDAFLLAYYADLRVRLPGPGVVSADAPDEVPEALRDDLAGIDVTVTPQGGSPQALLSGGRLTPLRFDAALPLTVRIRTRRTVNPWPTVVLDPKAGTVRATLGR
ncbi:hypothetical protein L1280_000102 [Deinococcus sp. HSC-46F16]|uniref:hypothetical protein n=1 Tax=Deinococcus sp. HSC-46F16 TaxID=2910968 RepID=UPI0020A2091C|nr:hypothetical protein [Deinococcus sp. HSC-46F16]MCP2012974.1 hypothetical protein [Deinococcus sp. HSC-46F16]